MLKLLEAGRLPSHVDPADLVLDHAPQQVSVTAEAAEKPEEDPPLEDSKHMSIQGKDVAEERGLGTLRGKKKPDNLACDFDSDSSISLPSWVGADDDQHDDNRLRSSSEDDLFPEDN